jgi:hypothetical protein
MEHQGSASPSELSLNIPETARRERKEGIKFNPIHTAEGALCFLTNIFVEKAKVHDEDIFKK